MELKKKEFLTRLTERGYLRDLVETILTEVRFEYAPCGFTRQTQNIKKDFAVCNDFQSCNSDSQKDSNKTLAPYYRQKTLAQIYPNADNVPYRKEKISKRFSC